MNADPAHRPSGLQTSYTGRAYRHCHPEKTNFDETLRFSVRYPGRFNVGGEFGALYIALDRNTAFDELHRRAVLSRTPLSGFAPRVMLTLDVHLARREGYEAIRYPSVIGGGDNLAVFLDMRHAGSHIISLNAEELHLND